MSSERDWEEEMKRFGLDDDTANRLLSGEVAPQDAPPGYEAVAEVILAARTSAPVDSRREAATVAASLEALRSGPRPQTPVRRERMLARLLSAKVAAIAAFVLLGATAAAAATSTLPDSAQGFVSNAARHVGLSIPKPNNHANAHASNHSATPANAAAVGPDASGDAKFGLCTAYAAGNATSNPHSHKSTSVAFRNLQAAATDAGMSIADYCKTATPPTTETTTTTTEPSAATTHGNESHGSNGGLHDSIPVGPPASTPVGPPVSTPVGPPVSVGPPTSTPVGPHISTPVGPPVSPPGDTHRP